MSVMCSDCPCRDTYAAEELLDYACNLYPDLVAPPAICTANPVLKILAEAVEIRFSPIEFERAKHYEKVEFWVRRA